MVEKPVQIFKALCNDIDGVILPYVTLMLVVIIGVAVLALDGARYMELQTQLQNGADALALAAAAELDRTPTAIQRALNAINKFGSGLNQNIKIADTKFLSSLPIRDSDPILPAHITNDPTRAVERENRHTDDHDQHHGYIRQNDTLCITPKPFENSS